MAFQIIQAATILCQAVVAIGKASSRLDILQKISPSPCTTCFMLLVMDLGPRFRVFSF
jgi:hypothetical protein